MQKNFCCFFITFYIFQKENNVKYAIYFRRNNILLKKSITFAKNVAQLNYSDNDNNHKESLRVIAHAYNMLFARVMQ